MANDLRDIANQLERISTIARKAEIDISALTAGIANLIRQSAQGRGTERGIQQAATRIASGQIPSSGVTRIGGGQRITLTPQLLSEVQGVANAVFTQMEAQVIQLRQARAKIEAQRAAGVASVTKEVEDELARINAQAAKTVADILRSKAATITGRHPGAVGGVGAVGAVIDVGNAPRPAGPPANELGTNYVEDLKKTLLKYNITDKIDFDNISKDNSKAFHRIISDARRLDMELNRFGNNLTSISGSKMTNFGQGLQKLELYFNDLANSQQKATYLLDQYGRALTATEVKQAKLDASRKQGAPTRASVEQSISQFRADRAYALAAEHGFAPETLQKVQISQPADIAKLIFAMQDNMGVQEKLTVTVDKYGQVLARTTRRELGFTQSLMANTVEMFKWSIGALLIYGTYEKLGRLINLAVTNQTRLADVTVALGEAQRDVNAVFEDAAEVANETGESVDGVLESYTMAYRAVGAIREPIERTAAANELLSDATTLNKLSNLDAAEAIDVLSGSLRQSETVLRATSKGFEENESVLTRGTDLLDKWVKVTRIANVDLATLSTAFSVTAESALNAGVSIEELNAIIASLSEKIGGLGGKETGNAVRALIGGVYQEQAATALNQYGIAVQDTEGRMRDFLSISRDIYELYRQGIIDDTQLNKLGYTLGGGVRRGQQYVAFLKDQARIQEIVNEQIDAEGSAAFALTTKLDTLETANVRLSNSFQKLAQVLGTDGGILDLMTGAKNSTTDLVDGLTSLVEILGKVTIPATLITAIGLFNALGGSPARNRTADLFSRMGGSIGGLNAPGYGIAGGIENLLLRGMPRMGFSDPTSLRAASRIGGTIGGATSGILLGLIPALTKLSSGDSKGAAVTMGASIAGAIAGSMVGGPFGALIGSTIGAFIAETFTAKIQDYEAEFTAIFAASIEKATEPDKVPGTEDYRASMRKEAVDEAYKLLGGYGLTKLGASLTGMDTEDYLIQQLTNLKNQKVAGPDLFGPVAKSIQQATEALDKIEAAGKTVLTEVALPETTFYNKQEQLTNELIDADTTRLQYIEELAESYREELYKRYKAKEISGKEYRQGVQQSFALGPSALRTGTALELSGTKADFKELSDILVQASAEDANAVAALVTDIQDLNTIIDETKGKEEDLKVMFRDTYITGADAADLLVKKNEELNTVLDLTKQAIQEAALAAASLYNVMKLEQYDTGQAERITERARELQQRELQAQVASGAITPEQMEALIAKAEPILIDLGRDMAFFLAKGITDSKYIQEAIEDMIANLELPTIDLGYQFMEDVTQAQFNAIMPQYEAIRNSILAAGGTSEETPLLTFFKDSTNPMLMTKDWRIVQYLLQEILKTEEKQLDGMYNLPSGASFYVPFQAWAMDKETRQASAQQENIPGPPVELDDTQFQGSVQNFDNAVNTLLTGIQKYYASLNPELDVNLDKAFNAAFDEKYGIKLEGIQNYYASLNPRIDAAINAMNQFTGPGGDQKTQVTEPYQPTQTTAPSYYSDYIESQYQQRLTEEETPLVGIETTISTWMNTLLQGLTGLFNQIFGIDMPSTQQSVPQTEVPPVETNLKITMQTQTQLVVDGRVLADIVKPYLYNDMVTSENSAGSTGTFVAI